MSLLNMQPMQPIRDERGGGVDLQSTVYEGCNLAIQKQVTVIPKLQFKLIYNSVTIQIDSNVINKEQSTNTATSITNWGLSVQRNCTVQIFAIV